MIDAHSRNFIQKHRYWLQVRDLQKKMQHVENDLDITIEKLSQTNLKFDEKDKLYQLAEGETQALNRKLVLLEDELQRSESKLATSTADLSEASTRADDINKAIKILETKNMIDEERKNLPHILLVDSRGIQ